MQNKNTGIFIILTMLAACSPHPGAGGWKAISGDALFEKLEIRFAGNADFYTRTDDETAAWRCFWAAQNKQLARLKCVEAANADNEQEYIFMVDADGGPGTLKLGDTVVGIYQWQSPAAQP
jgi:hypothetical protein